MPSRRARRDVARAGQGLRRRDQLRPAGDAGLAAAKKADLPRALQAPGAAAGWHFLTGDAAAIHALTKAAGFRYVWDDELKQFAHPTGIIVLTPEDGRALSVRHRLRSARPASGAGRRVGGQGRHRRSTRSALLLSLRPDDGPYGMAIMRAIRIAGAATVLSLGGFIVLMVRRERRRPALRTPRPSRSGTLAMWTGTPLFPQQASTMAARVDILYFFLLAVSAFFSILIAGLIVFYAVATAGARPTGRHEHPRRPVARGDLERLPLLISMVIFVWGASVFFAIRRPPTRR